MSSPIDIGGILVTEQRTIQSRGSGSSVCVNLTEFGRRVHGLESQEQVSVTVCDNGIWISTNE